MRPTPSHSQSITSNIFLVRSCFVNFIFNINVKEANIRFSPETITINYHEELNIALKTELSNQNNGFSQFLVREPRSVGVNVGIIALLLKSAPAKIVLTIFIERRSDPQENEKFGFLIEEPESGKVTRVDISPIDVDDEDIGDLEVNYGCNIVMQASEFLADINQLKVNGSDSLQICYYNGVLKYFSKCKNKANIETSRANTTERDLTTKTSAGTSSGHINIYVKLSKLVEIVKFSSISKTLVMHLQNNHILVLEYDISNLGTILFGIPNINKPEDY